MKRALEASSAVLALLGGLVLAALAVMATVSVLGRKLSLAPVPGDIELMQFGCAMAIALFLPYAQLKQVHITVDFFTARAAAMTRRRLAAGGNALLAAVYLLLAWRAAAGVIDIARAGETTMVLGWPLWTTYAVLVLGLALSAWIALYTALAQWRRRAAEQAGAPPQ